MLSCEVMFVRASQIDTVESEPLLVSPPTNSHFPSGRVVADWSGRRLGAEGTFCGLRDNGRAVQNRSARETMITSGRLFAGLACESLKLINFLLSQRLFFMGP